MRFSTFAVGAAGAIALAAIIGGGFYLMRASGDRDMARASGPAQPVASGGAATVLVSPAPPPPRPVSAAPPLQVPQPLAETFGEWRVWCELDVHSRESCRAERVVKGQDGKVQLALVAYPARAGAAARIRIMPPWGVLIEAGVGVRVDALPATPVPITTCLARGCVAELALGDSLLQAMRTGTEMKLAVVTADRQSVSTSVPLAGFADAYARISRTGAK